MVLILAMVIAGSARGQQTVGLVDLIVDGTDVEVPSGIRAIIGPGVTVIPGERTTRPFSSTPQNTHTHRGPKRSERCRVCQRCWGSGGAGSCSWGRAPPVVPSAGPPAANCVRLVLFVSP